MALSPSLFDGVNILAAPYSRASFVRGDGTSLGPVFEPTPVQVSGAFGTVAAAQPGGKSFPLYVQLVSPVTEDNVSTLCALFDPEKTADGTLVYLKATDGNAVTRRMAVAIRQIIPDEQALSAFRISLYAPDPRWEQDSEQSDPQADKNASPVNWTITPTGSMRTYPTIEITPDAVKAHANGYIARMFVVTANKVSRTVMDSLGLGFPVDIMNHLFDMATLTTGSMQADGDDLRVFVDGKRIKNFIGEDRFFGHIDAATTKVWTNIAFRPCRTATLDAAAFTAISPANTESIHVDNMGGLAGWPSSGYLLLDDEVIYYSERDSAYFYDIRRAQMGTAAAAHNDAITLYWVEHEIQVLYDYTAAANPPASTDVQPVIDLENSTNAYHVYPGPFIDPDSLRTGQFLATYRETNDVAPYLSMDDTGAVIKVVDTAPSAGKPARNNLELYTPLGVDTAAASLEQDVTVPNNMLARVYGTDTDGNESLLEEWNPDTDGANEQITPAGVLTRLRYEGLVRTVTGFTATGDAYDAELAGPATAHRGWAPTFVLAQKTVVSGFVIRAKKTAGATGHFFVAIREASDASPTVLEVWGYYNVETAALGVAYADVKYLFPTPVTLEVGTYSLYMYADTIATASVFLSGIAGHAWTYPVWKNVSGTWGIVSEPAYSIWFQLLGDGSVCQPEVPVGSAAIAQYDNIEITWDTPLYVKFQTAESVYAYSGILENLTTAQSVSIYAIGKVAEALTIDCAKREVTGGELGLPIPYCAEWSDEGAGLYLLPGVANSMRWTEAGIGTLTFVTTWRGRWS